MASEPGNADGDKPADDNKPGRGPTTGAPGSAPVPGRGPYLIITPSPASVLRRAEEPRPKADGNATQEAAQEPAAYSGEHTPPRLVDPPPLPPAEKPTTPRRKQPSLSAPSTDRLATMPPPPRRRGGGLILLLVLVLIVGGGYFLWRGGKLDPLVAWAQPYTETIRPLVAKIEALIPGSQEPAAQSDNAVILETKQLLLKLDFQPGPMNGTLDPATVAAIEAYQEAAGLPVDGQASQALLDDLRSVTNPTSN
jgi:Putative peptidoglycan binding domain